jgi:hypothetical protein
VINFDFTDIPLICPTRQVRFGKIVFVSDAIDRSGGARRPDASIDQPRRRPMYYVAAALLGLSGLFYSAGHNEIGSIGASVCSYGGTFCDNPVIVFAGAALAGAWGMFVSIR